MNIWRNPVDTFLDWYGILDTNQKLRIAIDLIYTSEDFENEFSSKSIDALEAPGFYLRKKIRSESGYIEILSRIGVLKTLVDVRLCAQYETVEASAFRQANLVNFIAKARAKQNQLDIEAGQVALKRAEEEQDVNTPMYVGWSDLVTPKPDDSSGENAPLSPRYLYRWACVQAGEKDPYIGS